MQVALQESHNCFDTLKEVASMLKEEMVEMPSVTPAHLNQTNMI